MGFVGWLGKRKRPGSERARVRSDGRDEEREYKGTRERREGTMWWIAAVSQGLDKGERRNGPSSRHDGNFNAGLSRPHLLQTTPLSDLHSVDL